MFNCEVVFQELILDYAWYVYVHVTKKKKAMRSNKEGRWCKGTSLMKTSPPTFRTTIGPYT